MKWSALAFCSLALMASQPAQAQAIVTLSSVNSFDDNNLTHSGTGASATVEVGDITEHPDPDTIGDRHALSGVVEVNALYDFDPEAIGELYLTFDVLAAGGSYPPEYGPAFADFAPGNIDRPFSGDIQFSWFDLDFPGQFSFSSTPITSFYVSAATSGVGSTFSLRIDQVLETVLNGQYGANEDVGFLLSNAAAPMDTAWMFNNFRLTRSDQTNLIEAPGSVVPEPATWALLIIGFGGVGSALRRGRRALAA